MSADILALPVEEVTLASGARALLRPQSHSDIVAVQCLLDITVFDEPAAQAGLANLVLRALRRGTAQRDARGVALALESLGASLGAAMTEDHALVTLQTTRGDLAEALALMAEVMREPVFVAEEVAKERDQILAEIRLTEDHPFQFALRQFRRALGGDHPCGRPVEGTPASVASLTPELCAAWHGRFFTPADALLVAVGHFDAEEMRGLLAQHFGAWPSADAKRPADRLRPLTEHRAGHTALARDVEQATCLVGWPAPALDALDDVVALRVAAGVLGAGMSSRLFQELRDKRGLAYSVGCSFGLRRAVGILFGHIGTHPDQADAAVVSIIAEIRALAETPVGDAELERTKTQLKGLHLIDHQTNARQAFHLGWGALTGLGHTFDARWPALIDAVTPAAIADVVARVTASEPTVVTLRP